jgi:hypothetical protein
VPKPVKILLWVLAFVLAAGLGALVASRSNPFPPGVEDPGARSPSLLPATSPPMSSSAGPQMWNLAMLVRSQHRLHEGGACRSNWRVHGRLGAQTDGTLAGRAVATLRGRATCDFPQAQVQTNKIGLEVRGSLHGEKVELRFRETVESPRGSRDLGGFVGTLPLIRPVVGIAQGRGTESFAESRPDGDKGEYASTGKLQLAL